MSLKDEQIALIKGMLLRGDDQHDIAALFGVNPARVAEVKAGMSDNPSGKTEKGRDIAPAPPEILPPPGPYYLNLVSERDIILDGLEAVEEAVAFYVGSQPGEAARDMQRRYHSALAERKRELWKGRKP